MGEDYSSTRARPDDSQFDKARWSTVLGAVQSRSACAQKASAKLCEFLVHQRVCLRDWLFFFVELNKRGRLVTLANSINAIQILERINGNGVSCFSR
jgi:hypothetical protein